ncbi:MAG TPA: papain-like cysteine protease family protein [Anaerolineales bacterium]|nr:papain-like cysteine protease family protein [Anaerolineales bacterium]
MKVIQRSPARFRGLALVCIAGLLLAGFTQVFGNTPIDQLKRETLSLDVPVLKQAWSTSCGEAVIAMTHTYAYPQTPLSEQAVIEFAAAKGYYTADKPPFTSPANMVKIAEHYAKDVSSGTVVTSQEGLALLIDRIKNGEPVIIDVLSNFSDPKSEAHFILVTGISVDPAGKDRVIIHYNDPLTGTKESAEWEGSQGVWNAWQMNGDPGGAGWWLVIPPG